MTRTMRGAVALGVMTLCSLVLACEIEEPTAADLATARSESAAPASSAEAANWSVTPALVKNVMPGVGVHTIIGSDDRLPTSPDFVFGGSADGAGLIRARGRPGFTLLVNHEDNFAVSRIELGPGLRPVTGEYLINSDIGRFRLCSATLATPQEHGFGPVFLTAGESGVESMTHAVDPYGPIGNDRLLPALGHWSAENAVPLPKQAYPGKTVILIGDDDSGPEGGQLAMYVSDRVGDLETGNLFVLAPERGVLKERDLVVGQRYPVVFKQIPGQTTSTGAQINAQAVQLGAFQFGRNEDVDYRKSDHWGPGSPQGREIYFLVTGQAYSGANADRSRSRQGRVYRLLLDSRDPTRGALEVVLDGDDPTGPARTFQNPDGILVTENYLYIGEDPNGYGDETHDAYLYQYHIPSSRLEVVLELDHRRTEADAAKYNGSTPSALGSWEFGAVLDVTTLVGGSRSAFLVAIQPHTWRGPQYAGVDGGATRLTEDQASQLILLTGLPR